MDWVAILLLAVGVFGGYYAVAHFMVTGKPA